MSQAMHFFRKHQKTILAVTGVFIIFTFTVGSYVLMSLDNRQQAAVDGTVVSWKHGRVKETDMFHMVVAHNRAVSVLQGISEEARKRQGQPYAIQVDPSTAEANVLTIMLLARKAESLGLSVTDDAVTQYLLRQGGGVLKQGDIKRVLKEMTQGEWTEQQFYEQMKTELLAAHMRMLAQTGLMAIPPSESFVYYERLERQSQIEALPVRVEDYLDKVPAEPSEKELRGLFDKYKDQIANPAFPDPGFRVPPQVAVQYVKVDFNKLVEEEKAKLTEEQIRAEYDKRVANGDFKTPELPELPQPKTPDEKSPEGIDAPKDPASPKDPDAPKDPADVKPDVPQPDVKKDDDKKSDEPKPEEKKEEKKDGDQPVEPATDPKAADDSKNDETKSDVPKTDPCLTLLAAQDDAQPKTEEPKTDKPLDELKKEDPPSATPATDPPATDKPAATDKPEEDKPTTDPATTDKPEGDKPATDKPATDPAATTDTPATDPVTPAKPKIQPYEKVRDEVARSLAMLPAEQRLRASFSTIEKEVLKYGRDANAKRIEAQRKKDDSKLPKLFDIADAATRAGLESESLDLTGPFELSELEIGKATARGANIFAGPMSFVQVAFAPNKALYRPETVMGPSAGPAGGVEYLFWLTDTKEEYTPSYEDVRDQVLAAWKRIEARKLAQAEAEKLAKSVGEKQTLKEVFTDKAADVIQSGLFSWLEPTTMPWGMPGRPQMSQVAGIDGAGNAFMKEVFKLAQGETGVAVNQAESIYYVVQVIKRTPTDAELRERFAATGMMLSGRNIQAVGSVERGALVSQWFSDLSEEYKVKWERDPRGAGEN